MKKEANLLPTAVELRRQAERRLKAQRSIKPSAKTEVDSQRLVHELQVHQIELEMQNGELQRARVEVEAALEKYTELYDFAPVGYFSIDQQGRIREANLTGAAMLGAPRSRLIQQRLLGFVAPTSRQIVNTFVTNVLSKPGMQACEALLLSATNNIFWADLQASPAPLPSGGGIWCRLAVSDITALKRGEEAQRSVQSLAAANLEANREIARRRAAEASLKESELTQRGLLAESRRLHAHLKYLTHQILMAQEEERKQISRELHDDIAQILAGINVQLTALSMAASIDPRALRKRIAKTKRLVAQSVNIVHRFARKLRPTVLDDLGLIPALRSIVNELSGRKGLEIQLIAFGGVEALESPSRTVLYRVAQEALTNVVRHARAHHAAVRVQRIPNAVRLEVSDDGISFPVERLLSAKHGGRLGLLGMRERVEMVGGRFSIESAQGKGTVVTAEIPFHPAKGIRGKVAPPQATVLEILSSS